MSHPFIINERLEDGLHFTWKINLSDLRNFSTEYDYDYGDYPNGITISSDKFSIADTAHHMSDKWQLLLKIMMCDHHSSEERFEELKHYDQKYVVKDFKIGLKCLQVDFLKRKVKFSPAIRNQSGNTYCKFKLTHLFSNSTTEIFSKRLVFPTNNKAILNGRVFQFSHSQMIINGDIRMIEDESLVNKPASHLQRDLKAALLDKQFADVTFKVKDNTLHAHKIILASRSPVFRRMFEHDMMENSSNIILIDDFEKPILEIFLSFLYTGILEECKLDSLMSLYSIADKYEVKSLQTTCTEQLIPYLCSETVPTLLKLAHMHSDSHLKTIAIEFISNHFVQVETTEAWQLVLDTDPPLASETLRYVSTHMLKK